MSPLDCIIQWNMQSYKTKFHELKLLLREYTPACVCLQETLLRNTSYTPSGYHLVKSFPVRDDGHERGSAILIHKRVPYEIIYLNTNLQAVAVRIHLRKTYTICSIYFTSCPCQ